jgi:N utilization substance protein B
MDMVILKMALAEARICESIPLKVSMNEYIELANYYSTPKSNVFINGLLETLFNRLVSEGKINKLGRGLLES